MEFFDFFFLLVVVNVVVGVWGFKNDAIPLTKLLQKCPRSHQHWDKEWNAQAYWARWPALRTLSPSSKMACTWAGLVCLIPYYHNNSFHHLHFFSEKSLFLRPHLFIYFKKGFTGVGYPKVIPTALADHVERNNLQGKLRFNLFVGASTGVETEDRWAKLNMIDRRSPHQVIFPHFFFLVFF